MKTIEQSYTIKAPISKVWRALVDPIVIGKWGGGPAKMGPNEGTKFSLWGGEIHGTNTKVVTEKLLEQEWYSEDHPGQKYKVSFQLSQTDGSTTIKLVHANVSEDAVEDFSDGWQDYYLGPLKDLLED